MDPETKRLALDVFYVWWGPLAVYAGLLAYAEGLLAGFVAQEKGRSGGRWFLLGFLVGIPALVALAGLPRRRQPQSEYPGLGLYSWGVLVGLLILVGAVFVATRWIRFVQPIL